MTKIEVYQKAKQEVEKLEKFITNWNDSSCDKKGMRFNNVETYMGWYGNSSVSSWDESVLSNMKEIISEQIPCLAVLALEKAKKNAEKKRIEAQEEARAILIETEK